jgi:hypothetical protein
VLVESPEELLRKITRECVEEKNDRNFPFTSHKAALVEKAKEKEEKRTPTSGKVSEC